MYRNHGCCHGIWKRTANGEGKNIEAERSDIYPTFRVAYLAGGISANTAFRLALSLGVGKIIAGATIVGVDPMVPKHLNLREWLASLFAENEIN